MVDSSSQEKIAASSRGIGSLKITGVEPVITRTPMSKRPADEFIEMPPIGFMHERVGIGKRLDHASPSRFKGYSQTLLVKVTTDQGLVGWGEAHAPAAPAVHAKVITDLLAPILIGQDARRIGPLWDKMYSSQRLRGYATGFFTESIAGVDIALWDILGKFVGVPLYQLLGGKYRDSIPTYSAAGSPEAALEARLELSRRLHTSFSDPERRREIAADLGQRLPAFESLAWSAMGRALWAEFVQQQGEHDSKLRAREIAAVGVRAYPGTPGAQACQHWVETIEQPQYSMTGMATDAPGRASIGVSYANVKRLWFRAYALDVQKRIESAKDYNLLPNGKPLKEGLETRKPAFEWSVDLPETSDFRTHQHMVTSPIDRPGFYTIVASARENFQDENNVVAAMHMAVGDLVMLVAEGDNAGSGEGCEVDDGGGIVASCVG